MADHILIAADRKLVVEALTKLLEPRFKIVGTVSNSGELLEAARRLKPDLVILDIKVLPRNADNSSEQLKKLLPETKQIVLAMNYDAEREAASLRKWVSGLIEKSNAGAALIHAIRRVLKGKANVSPRMTQRAYDSFLRNLRADHEKHLTARQREVLQLLAEGHTMKEAADLLHITARTIAFHKYRMMETFGLETNSDLFRFALEKRVITTPLSLQLNI